MLFKKRKAKNGYSYFVSYNYAKKIDKGSQEFGFGMVNIRLEHKVCSYDDVFSFKKSIEEIGMCENVIIINYHLLKE